MTWVSCFCSYCQGWRTVPEEVVRCPICKKEWGVPPPQKKYGQFDNVLLSDREYQKLKERFGEALAEKVEALSLGIASKGYKYASHYATILNWERMHQKKAQHGKPGGPHGKDQGEVPARTRSR